MSGDQLATSFGDPNAQPPTPKQTPTSLAFPSPVFETPKQAHGHFDDSGGWTPRFAEEYSVFNATPGNLRGSQGSFVDYGPATPYPPSAGLKRPLSAGGIAAEIATHVTHFSPNPNLPLPPVDPSRCLQSSPASVAAPLEQSATGETLSPVQERFSKKVRRGTLIRDAQGQTATPPPSARKGERKLAPKVNADTMQNDQGFPQPDFTATPQQPSMVVFVTTPTDMFGYPMSAPATAPAFTNARPFWDDTGMAGMDIDFAAAAAAAADVFQTPTPSHRPMGSLDWGRSNQIFQETGVVPPPGQENVQQQIKRERPIAPKTMMPANVDTSVPDHSVFSGSYPTPVDDPFGIVGSTAGVNPGLLFSQPPSSSIEATAFSAAAQPSSSAPAAPQTTQTPRGGPTAPKAPTRGELRRSVSVKEMGLGGHRDRISTSSPIKPIGRPGLSRSFSENRGKRPVGRASLPSLAPAPRASSQPQAGTGPGSNRAIPQANRPAGRTSPSKGHHHRLSSLTSIPEGAGPRTRKSVQFTIDANGKARAETTVVVEEEEPPPAVRRRHSARPLNNHQPWDSSDDESSTDDEPIIIPSRTTSFALPDPIKPSTTHPFHSSRRSISEKSTSTYATFAGGSQDDGESEAETVMNDQPVAGKLSGDAASELQKLVETRQKRPSIPKLSNSSRPRMAPGGGAGGSFGSRYPGNNVSPSTLTDSSLPTPSTDPRGQGVRCVCNRPGVEGDDFMIQCESCEMWLHGRCINISKRTLPNVYICAFCANTPNMRGGRVRAAGTMGPPGSATSPLAHKSFRSFR